MQSKDHYACHTISEQDAGKTIEEFLRQTLDCSARLLQKLTRASGVTCNGKRAHLQRRLCAGDVVRLRLLEERCAVQPEPGALTVLYEDEDLVVLDKPPFLLVHPTGMTKGGTLANRLAHHFAAQERSLPIRPLHRLDRDTSGCVAFAKSAAAQTFYTQQLETKTLTRIYTAVVCGALRADGVVDLPIARDPAAPNRRKITASGDAAVTRYRVLAANDAATCLELQLETGRTHQIRLHLSAIGHSVVGDRMYGRRSPQIARQALHASALCFARRDGTPACVRAPLPADMQALLSFYGLLLS